MPNVPSNSPSNPFRYGGSTTWASIRNTVDVEIQKAQPNFHLKHNDPDPVNNLLGSDPGIEMLLKNELDFSQSSRELSPDEQQKGLKQIAVAIDGIAFAVNPKLGIQHLTLEQLKGIYTGKLTYWNQVGGDPNLPIHPYSRRLRKGGTVDYLINHFLCQSLGNNVRPADDTTNGLRKVINEQGSIYYASASEVVNQCQIRPLSIDITKDDSIPPYQPPWPEPARCVNYTRDRTTPNTTAFEDGSYPITRVLYVIINQKDEKQRKAGEAYANLLLSDQGQQLLKEAGFGRIEK